MSRTISVKINHAAGTDLQSNNDDDDENEDDSDDYDGDECMSVNYDLCGINANLTQWCQETRDIVPNPVWSSRQPADGRWCSHGEPDQKDENVNDDHFDGDGNDDNLVKQNGP